MTRDLKLPKAIKRITVVQASPTSAGPSLVVYSAESKKKKQSKGLRVLEKLARRNARSSQTFADIYLERHDRSNRKKRDGWLRDLGYNVLKANDKAGKKLALVKIFKR